jgi:phenylpyruvate tautomerase PptA (4-oxalocrotonate tautomerase family)
MPFVRIFHPSTDDQFFSQALSQGVHRALVGAFGIPQEDFFQVVSAHPVGIELRGPTEFFGNVYSDDLVMIQITCAEGRTTAQKKALFKAIAENVSNDAGIPSADVMIHLIETKRENWSFGGGIAHYA